MPEGEVMMTGGKRYETRLEKHHDGRVVKSFVHRADNVADLLQVKCREHCSDLALIHGDQNMTYDILLRTSAAFASVLEDGGLKCGDRVGILVPNSIDFIAAFYGALLIGAVPVPLNVREQEPEVRHILNDCAAKSVIFDPALAHLIPQVIDAPTIALRIAIDSPGLKTPLGDDAVDRLWKPPVVGDDPATIIYTSGTTGKPKGAVLSHFALISAAQTYEATFGLDRSDRVLVSVPLTHVTGLTGCMLAALSSGCSLIVMTQFKAKSFLETASRLGMTMTVMVPAMYKLCLLCDDFSQFDLRRWRIGAFGGSPMTPSMVADLRAALPNLELYNVYGATETGGGVAIMPPKALDGREDSVGRETLLSEIIVMDEDGCELPPGQPGELWVRSATNATCYWNNAEVTAREFSGGFWHTGDIGTKDLDGYVRIVDRKKAIINRGGFKIASLEVENLINSVAGVIESAVFGVPCPVLGERVYAVVVTLAGGPSAEEISLHCKAKISDYKVPEKIIVTNEPLPRNANGKIVKASVADLAKRI